LTHHGYFPGYFNLEEVNIMLIEYIGASSVKKSSENLVPAIFHARQNDIDWEDECSGRKHNTSIGLHDEVTTF
jgi:hypothetical protein